MKSVKTGARRRSKGARAADTAPQTLTDEERAAMKALVKERKAQAGGSKADGEAAVLAAIAAFTPADRAIAERLHALIRANAPDLAPKTWYGMPAYARNDKVVCFFQNAGKFKARYNTLGFSDQAKLDDGDMWPTTFALKALTPTEEARICALLKTALG